jgi:hypothetical protein
MMKPIQKTLALSLSFVLTRNFRPPLLCDPSSIYEPTLTFKQLVSLLPNRLIKIPYLCASISFFPLLTKARVTGGLLHMNDAKYD